LLPVSFGVSTKFYYRISYPIIVYTTYYITKNIAYRITEVLIFYYTDYLIYS